MSKKWKRVLIPEVLFFQEGPGVRKWQFTSEGVKLLNVGNINNGLLDLSTTKLYVSNEEANGKYKHFLVDEGDLLIASSGILVENFHNKIAYAKKEHLPLCLNTSTIRFKPLDKNIIDLDFFKYFLMTQDFKDQLNRLITGSAQLNFGPSHLKQMTLPLPPLPEQRRIAAILDTADLIRRKRKAAIAKLDELAQSVFYEMFGDPIIGNTGLPIHPLGKLCDVRDGTHDSPKYIEENGFPLVTSKNLSSGFLDLSKVNLISKSDFDSINKRSKVDRGDIIMPMIGTIGSPVLIEEEPLFAIKNVALIKFQKDSPLPKYIRHILSCDYFEYVVKQINKGGTQKFISLGDIRSFPIPVAIKSQQKEFVHKIDAIGVLRESHQFALSREETLFSSLQHRAFAGEL